MSSRAYVGNLPYTATEQEIRDFFSTASRKVTDVKIITDRETQRPRGFAFVGFSSKSDMISAVEELNGSDFGGRRLIVDIATDKPRVAPAPQSHEPVVKESRRRERSHDDVYGND